MPDVGKDTKADVHTDGSAEDETGAVAIPAGVIPFFFSAAGQQLFQCVVDQEVTPEAPRKLISKETILKDFGNRAAVSDFHPVKKKINEYKGDELLIVYDHDYKYGENFYICITIEAKDLILKRAEEEAAVDERKQEEEEEEDEIPKTPVPEEWVCLGSDLEIREAHFQDSRPLLKYTVSRKRAHFENTCTFTSQLSSLNPDSCIDIASQEDLNFDLHRMEMERGTQAIAKKAESSCQTEWLKPCNIAVQYTPRQLSDSELKEAMTNANMDTFLSKVIPKVEVCLQQNAILNMFEDDYRNLSDVDGITGRKSDTTLKEYQSFADLRFSKNKVITQIEWHPTIKGIIAVSCGESLSFDEHVDLTQLLVRKQSLVLIWSFTDPIHPVLFLEAPDNVLCFKFNPTNPNLIVGGCANGQLIMWNIEDYQDYLQINKTAEAIESRATAANMAIFDTDPKLDHAPMVQHCVTGSIKDGHSREIHDVQWLPHDIEICHKTGCILNNPSHQCCQLISSSIDGCVFVWDIRPTVHQTKPPSQEQKSSYAHLDLTWKPLIKIPMPRPDRPGKFAARKVSIRYKHTDAPKVLDADENSRKEASIIGQGSPIEDANTMFFVGTEDGEVVYCDWQPTKDSETGKSIAPLPSYYFGAHFGLISSVDRSPFFRDILLTVGGCTWVLWKEGANSGHLLTSSCSTVPLTGGAWSPTRPGVFFIIKSNGNVDVWDLMDRSHEGLLTQNISSLALTSIFPWQLTSKQMMLAVGDSAGTLHILEIPWNLSHPSSNEVAIMENFFQRQIKRLDFTTARMERRDLEKKAFDASKAEEKIEEIILEEKWDEKAKKSYDEYLALELKLLLELGVVIESKHDD